MSLMAIVQARTGSTRLPNKVLLPVCGVPMIDLLLDRLSRSRHVDRIVVATTTSPGDDALAEHSSALGYETFRGSENDVLGRFHAAACFYDPANVVRITADNPLTDPAVVDQGVDVFAGAGADYVSNTMPPTFPDGLEVEAFTRSALERAHRDASSAYDREHVTAFLKNSGRFTTRNVELDENLSSHRWTVDFPGDLIVVDAIFRHFGPRRDFGWREVLALEASRPELFHALAASGTVNVPRSHAD
jgi:glutamate-1-semialdehyde 2,1-aminomutase